MLSAVKIKRMGFFFTLQQFSAFGLLALRIAIGAIFWVHGTAKWAMWRTPPSAQMPSGMLRLMKILSIAEPVGALMLAAGFLTQIAAAGLGVIMLGALYFKIRAWKIPFTAQDKTGWEFDLMILAGAIALLFLGGGAWGLDQLLKRTF